MKWHGIAFKNITYVPVMLITALIAGVAFGGEESHDFLDQQKLHSNLVIDMLMQHIDKGEIDIFGHVLKPDELEKRYVAYVYHFKGDRVSIDVHFKLKIKITVPNFESYYVDAISIDIDNTGRIEKIRTQVKPF
ncbi:MAG: hypothetical protein PVJ39_02230 [Gammaproteobacteria bacterium]|jgi:hypothetical protein